MSNVIMYLEIVSCVVFFFKQKTAYEMRISDWSSDVCSSDLIAVKGHAPVASEALKRIQLLYAIEAEIRGQDAEARRRLRQERARPEIGRASCRERVCQYV